MSAASGRLARARACFVAEASFDTRGLAIFRILAGAGLILSLFSRMRGGALVAFHTDLGVLPSEVMRTTTRGSAVWSWLYYVHTPLQMQLATLAMALVFACLAIGYRTRLSALLSLLSILSLHHRNPLVTTAAQVFVNVAAVWSVFLPLGEVWSVDAWRRARRAPSEAAPPRRARVVSLAALGLRLHVFLIYLFNVVQKDGPSWTGGQAFHRMLRSDWTATPLAFFLRDHEPAWLSPLLTYAVLGIEASIALLVVSPFRGRLCRRVAAALIVLLHASIHVFGDLGLFPYTLSMLALLLVTSDDFTAVTERALAFLEPRAPGLARWLRETGPEGGAATPRPAIQRLALGARELFFVVLSVAVTWNVWDVNVAPERWLGPTTAAPWAQRVVDFLDLPGGWHLFSPDVPSLDVHVVVDAVLPDGRHLDPLTGRAPDLDVLEHGPQRWHYLWQAYQMELSLRNQRALWVPFVAYLRRVPTIEGWRGPRHFESIDVWVVSVRRPDFGRPETPVRRALAARWSRASAAPSVEEPARLPAPSAERMPSSP